MRTEEEIREEAWRCAEIAINQWVNAQWYFARDAETKGHSFRHAGEQHEQRLGTLAWAMGEEWYAEPWMWIAEEEAAA